MVNNSQSRRKYPEERRVTQEEQAAAQATMAACRRSDWSWLFAWWPGRATTKISNARSANATERANRESLLEGSKGDLATTDASLFILRQLDNGLVFGGVVLSTGLHPDASVSMMLWVCPRPRSKTLSPQRIRGG